MFKLQWKYYNCVYSYLWSKLSTSDNHIRLNILYELIYLKDNTRCLTERLMTQSTVTYIKLWLILNGNKFNIWKCTYKMLDFKTKKPNVSNEKFSHHEPGPQSLFQNLHLGSSWLIHLTYTMSRRTTESLVISKNRLSITTILP